MVCICCEYNTANYTVSDIDDAAASEGESLLGKVEYGMREREWCERNRREE